MSHPAQRPSKNVAGRAEVAALRDTQRGATLLLVGILLGMLPLPYRAIAGLALLPSLFFFVRALRQQIGRVPVVQVLWTALGFVFASMTLAGALLPYFLLDSSMALQECLAAANTLQAEADCTAHWSDTFSRFTQGR